MALFYGSRNLDDAVLKRNGGFANRDAAKEAARPDARKMKSASNLVRPEVARTLVGRNTEKPTRY
jgi:hypothetical protein